MYKKEKMFHVKRFVWNNRKSSDIIEPAIDVYKINLNSCTQIKIVQKNTDENELEGVQLWEEQ